MDSFDKETGHLIKCKYEVSPNVTKNGGYPKTYCAKCFKQIRIAVQSCAKYCVLCWKIICIKNSWDSDLSSCANVKCDQLKIPVRERFTINIHNLTKKVGISSAKKFVHLSITRRCLRNQRTDLTVIDANAQKTVNLSIPMSLSKKRKDTSYESIMPENPPESKSSRLVK